VLNKMEQVWRGEVPRHTGTFPVIAVMQQDGKLWIQAENA
jgi:hypothetical protein